MSGGKTKQNVARSRNDRKKHIKTELTCQQSNSLNIADRKKGRKGKGHREHRLEEKGEKDIVVNMEKEIKADGFNGFPPSCFYQC